MSSSSLAPVIAPIVALARNRSKSTAFSTLPIEESPPAAAEAAADEESDKQTQDVHVHKPLRSSLTRWRTGLVPKRRQVDRRYSARDRQLTGTAETMSQEAPVPQDAGQDTSDGLQELKPKARSAVARAGSNRIMGIIQNKALLKRLSRGSLQGPSFFASALTSASAAANASEEAAGRQYEEMMEHFQIRRLQHTPSGASVSGGRAREEQHSTSRSHKVVPADIDGASGHRGTGSSRSDSPPANKDAPPPSPEQPAHSPSQSHPQPSAPVINRRSSVLKSPGALPSTSVRNSRSRLSLRWTLATWKRRLRRKTRAFVRRLAKPLSPFSTTAFVRATALLLTCGFHVVCFPFEKAFVGTGHVWFPPAEYATALAFLLDFALTFNTAFQDKRGVLVTSRREIAAHYLRGWCVADMFGAVPVVAVLESADHRRAHNAAWLRLVADGVVSAQRILHVVRVLRLLWMLRVSKSGKSIWAWLLYSRYSHLLRILWVVLLIVLLAHYMACVWKLLEAGDDRPRGQSAAEQYAGNFYDALQLLQGQGLATRSTTQSVFASVAVLLGSVVLAVVFGHVAVLVANFNANSTNYQRKMESVFASMRKLQLPAPLRERIRQYYEHLWREYESLDGELAKFSKGLTHNLALEVVLFKYMDLVLNVPYWKGCTPDFHKHVVLSLQVRVYLPDDFILRRGEVADEFYMINRGSCELATSADSFEHATPPLPARGATGGGPKAPVAPATTTYARSAYFSHAEAAAGDDTDETEFDQRAQYKVKPSTDGDQAKHVRLLVRGQAFGEIALLMNYQRTANVRAVSYVEMCVLTRGDFQQILTRHPGDRKTALRSILQTCIESNERRRTHCPLKQVVHDVFHGSVLADEQLTAQHAAAVITAVVNPDGDTGKITVGVGKNLKRELQQLKFGGAPELSGVFHALQSHRGLPSDRSGSSDATPDATNTSSVVSGAPLSSSPTSGAATTSSDLDTRVQRIESLQLQTLLLLQDMRSAMDALRSTATQQVQQQPNEVASMPTEPPVRVQRGLLVAPALGVDAVPPTSGGRSEAEKSDPSDPPKRLTRIASRRASYIRNRSSTAPSLNELTQSIARELELDGDLKQVDAANKVPPTASSTGDKNSLGRLAARRRSSTLADLTDTQRRQLTAPPQAPPKRAPLRLPFKLRSGAAKQNSTKRNSSSTRQLLHRMGSLVSFAAGPQPSPSPTCYADQLFLAHGPPADSSGDVSGS